MPLGKQELAEEIQGAGGIITASDLLDAQPIIRQPLRSQASYHPHLSCHCGTWSLAWNASCWHGCSLTA